MKRVKALVIFAGRTSNDKKVVLYKERDSHYYLLRPDGETVLLDFDARSDQVFEWWGNWTVTGGADGVHHLRVELPQWTGRARGTKRDMADEPPLYHTSEPDVEEGDL